MKRQDAEPLLLAEEGRERDGASGSPEPPFSRVAYAIILFMGFGMLAPWNILLNSIPYFQEEYPAQKAGVAFYMTAAYIYPQLPLLGVMVGFGSRVAFRWRVVFPLLLQLAALVILPIVAPTSIWATLCIIFLVGLCTAVFQSSGFAFASLFPPVYAQAIMFGQGLAGVTAGVAELIVMGAVSSAQAAAIAYFVFAAVCLGLCAGSYLYLERLPFTKFYLARAATATGASASTGVEGLDKRLSLQEGSGTASDEEEDSIMMSLTSSGNGKGGAARRSFEVGSSSDSAPLTGAPSTAITAVLRGIWPMAAAVFSVFFMTFLVFPGVAPASVEFKNTWGSMRVGNDWWNAILLLVFNVADTIGRAAPAWVQLLKGYPLLIATFARYAIIPLFLGCARSWSPFFGDATVLVVMAVFAITNGYFSSLAMMLGPGLVAPRQRERAGLLMSFFLQLGLLLGSQVAFAFTGGPAT